VIITSFPELASLGKPWGASGCLDKCCTPEELVAAIRQAHAAEAPVPPHELTTVRDHRTTIRRLAIRASLTEREQLVVEKVVTTELTIREIAMALSSDLNEPVTSSAVTHTLERAMTKLRISPRTRTALVKHVLALSANDAGEPAPLAPPEWEAFPVPHRSGAAFAS
jgi:DNA-binding NarL/FixJ family response regulator